MGLELQPHNRHHKTRRQQIRHAHLQIGNQPGLVLWRRLPKHVPRPTLQTRQQHGESIRRSTHRTHSHEVDRVPETKEQRTSASSKEQLTPINHPATIHTGATTTHREQTNGRSNPSQQRTTTIHPRRHQIRHDTTRNHARRPTGSNQPQQISRLPSGGTRNRR